MQSNRGFTLIEILISLTILSLTFLVAGNAMSLFINNWEKVSEQLHKNEFLAIDLNGLNNTLKNIEYYDRYEPSSNAFHPYFYGRNKKMSFITKQPVFLNKNLSLVELAVVKSENGEQLQVSEYDISNDLNLDNLDKPIYSNIFLTADEINFSYEGFSQVGELTSSEEYKKPELLSSYEARKTGLLPIRINLNLKNNDSYSTISVSNPYFNFNKQFRNYEGENF